MPRLKFKDEQTGQVVEIDWNGPGEPTDADIQAAMESGPSVSGFGKNVLKSGGRFLSDTASALAHPIDTGKGILKLASGAAQLLVPGEQGNEPVARAAGEFYKDRYGGLKNIGRTLYEDPVGAAADLSTVLGGGAAVLKAGKLNKAAQIASKASNLTNPAAAVMKPVGAGLKGLGVLATEASVRPPAPIKRQQRSRFEASKTIAEHALYNPRKASALGREAAGRVDELATQSPYVASMSDIADLPKTMDKALASDLPDNAVSALGDYQADLVAQNPSRVDAPGVVRLKRAGNRGGNSAWRDKQRDMPGGEPAIVREARKEMAQNASRALHENVPGTAEADDLARRAMLAQGALKAGENRPHLLSKLLALSAMTGSAFTGVPLEGGLAALSLLALDSPQLGARAGAGGWRANRLLSSDAATRAALLARLQESLKQE